MWESRNLPEERPHISRSQLCLSKTQELLRHAGSIHGILSLSMWRRKMTLREVTVFHRSYSFSLPLVLAPDNMTPLSLNEIVPSHLHWLVSLTLPDQIPQLISEPQQLFQERACDRRQITVKSPQDFSCRRDGLWLLGW